MMAGGYLSRHVNKFNRPRCAMPTITSSMLATQHHCSYY